MLQVGKRGEQTCEHGFTLVEVLVALAIVAFATATIGARLGRSSDTLSVQALAGHTASRARAVRDRAVRQGQDGVLIVDLETRRVNGTPQSPALAIAPDVDVEVVVASQEQRPPARAMIRFFANGTSTGGTIRYGNKGTAYEVRISWFNGRVSVVRSS